MSRVSIDIVDQIESERFKPTASLGPSTPEEDKQDHRPPLGIELTGYRLLTLAVILAFGIPKAILSYRGQTSSTTLDWVSGTLLAAVLYYVGLLQDKRPDICPYFSQVDLAPPILKFVHSSELYCFLSSLSPLQPAAALLQFALTFKEARSIILSDVLHEPTGVSFVATRNAIIMAVVCIILGILSALQHLTKPVYRLRGLHGLLTQDVVSMGLLIAWAALQRYIDSIVMLEFTSTVPIRGNYGILSYGYAMSDTVTMGHVMTTAPIFLLLETVKLQGAPLLLRLTEGHPKSQRLVERLEIMPQLTKAIPWALLYVVVLVMTLAGNYENPYYALHLCYLIIFFLHRFLTNLPTWCSSVAKVRKIVCGAVSTYCNWK